MTQLSTSLALTECKLAKNVLLNTTFQKGARDFDFENIHVKGDLQNEFLHQNPDLLQWTG
jgi:hypothetical protein